MSMSRQPRKTFFDAASLRDSPVNCTTDPHPIVTIFHPFSVNCTIDPHPIVTIFHPFPVKCTTDDVSPGDARAVLGRSSGALRLSYDHKGVLPAMTSHL